MSLLDKFDNEIEPAFDHCFDRESARRQLRVSILLVSAMALAAFVLGFALPSESPKPSHVAPTAYYGDGFSGRLVTIDGR